MDARIATAVVRFRLDVNFGDPVTPAPRMIELPSLRPDTAALRVLGYPIETVLARSWRPRSCSAQRTPACGTTPTSIR